MSHFAPLNPRPMLQNLVGKDILVRLKWGHTEYSGRLVSVDSYMNLQLENTREYLDGKETSALGMILIRCNNVLWVSGKGLGQGQPNGDADGDERMEE